MAERPPREGPGRRLSFRRVRADAGLPDEYLELLEQKRKQLDESIHKYIAAKERDFKTFERDLRLQYRQDHKEQSQDGHRAARASLESSSSAHDGQRSQQQSVVDALLAAGVRQEHVGQPLSVAVIDQDGSPKLEAKSAAGLLDRRASIERDKEFVGVFTPAFLPALENKRSSTITPIPERAESAPPPSGHANESEQPTIIRAHSDHVVQAKAKRPVQLQLTQRTSSSGSSADGRLTSALKSPTQGTKPKRKRVSLAVGDEIVKPSDSVPNTLLNNNRTPSHSRTRKPSESDRDRGDSIDAKMANGNGTETKGVAVETEQKTSPPPCLKELEKKPVVDSTAMPNPTKELRVPAAPPAAAVPAGAKPAGPIPSSPLARPPAKIDADGDLFDLEEEDEEYSTLSNGGRDNPSESEDDIIGRVDFNPSPEGGGTLSNSPSEENSPEDLEEDHAEHVEFIPGSANASQQPTNPGFRRPSAVLDPIYGGANYERAEHNAVVNDIYGSSYIRPATKGSFTSGSLGESFMARNAQMMRERAGSGTSRDPQQTEVRS